MFIERARVRKVQPWNAGRSRARLRQIYRFNQRQTKTNKKEKTAMHSHGEFTARIYCLLRMCANSMPKILRQHPPHETMGEI